jgi:uncharacterized protein YaiI (UPF0178 family)
VKLFVDADSCPAAARTVIQKRAAKERLPLLFAANHPIPFDRPYLALVERGLFVMEICPLEENAADDRITALAEKGDIAVTRDLPLACRLVKKNVHTLDDRGRIFTEDNIRHYLSLRNFNVSLAGTRTSVRIASYSAKEKKTFADSLDRIITASRMRDKTNNK